MLKAENVETFNFDGAIRGMRNPLNSWEKSDSGYNLEWVDPPYIIGPNDLGLMNKLYNAGPSHRKVLRQMFICMDITAPLYWWKEFDTYKVGTVANSCSTMHKIAAKKFEVNDFSCEHLLSLGTLRLIIEDLNYNRDRFIETKNKDYWWQLIQLLPSSYNQLRTVTMSYENAVTIIDQRKGHKLDEWKTLIDVLMGLPYMEQLIPPVDADASRAMIRDSWILCPKCHHKLGRALSSGSGARIEMRCQSCKETVIFDS